MASITEKEPGNYMTINFEETELRLGLPGGGAPSNGKRPFSQTLDADDHHIKDEDVLPASSHHPPKPPAKAQVVGWPPIRSFRKNVMTVEKNSSEQGATSSAAGAAFVKVSMDGAPYLRKVDLKLYKSYQELSDGLAKMFSSFTIGNCGSQGIMKDFMNESKLVDILNGSEYVPTYEDKDGDWMLVGDVPWEMFVYSCKRLRIMKGSEAIGLAPKALEKCKNRS